MIQASTLLPACEPAPTEESHPLVQTTISARLLARIRDTVETHHLFAQPDQEERTAPVVVVVAVSGGADSVCLLHALVQLAPAHKLALHVAHLDHALRPESAQEAQFVTTLAESYHLPIHTMRLAEQSLEGHPGGLEDAARRARYAFLHHVATSVTPTTQLPIVAVAHHQDDQAETLLMNLIRGSGLEGLAAMSWASRLPAGTGRIMRQDVAPTPNDTRYIGKVQDTSEATGTNREVRLVRPLLGLRRAEIQQYLLENHLTWCEDTSNRDLTYLRNRIRHEIMPLLAEINPNLVPTLARTASILEAEANHAAERDRCTLTALRLDESPADTAAERIVLNLERLITLDLATQRGVLRLAIQLLNLDLRDADFDQIDSLLRQLQQPHTNHGPHTLAGDVAWTVLAASGENPARLSLHRNDVLPIQPDHPHLSAGTPGTFAPLALPCPGVLSVPDGWELYCQVIARDQLPADWRTPGQPWRAFLDMDRIGSLQLMTPRPGLRIAPLGMQGETKTLGDFFTDRKIPAALRPGWPLLYDSSSNQIVWVCGLTIAHSAALHPGTGTILWLEWRRKQ